MIPQLPDSRESVLHVPSETLVVAALCGFISKTAAWRFTLALALVLSQVFWEARGSLASKILWLIHLPHESGLPRGVQYFLSLTPGPSIVPGEQQLSNKWQLLC